MSPDYQKYFQTFASVSKAIHSGADTQAIIHAIVSHVTKLMDAVGCIFWIVNPEKCQIETRVSRGFAYQSLLSVDYETLDHIFSIEQCRPVNIKDARYDPRIPDLERLGKKRVISVFGFPVSIAAPYTGVLAVYFNRKHQLAGHEIEFVNALAEQGAIALRKSMRFDEHMLETFQQTVEGLVLALEAKDTLTHGHSLRVAHLARLTAEAMDLTPEAVDLIYRAALLHDIGKIGMTDKILSRLGKLRTRELAIIRRHPVIGANILKPLPFFKELAPMIRAHHERFDGSGYPDGLAGDQIPLGGRILGVCDAFETMISGRPHIRAMSLRDAVERLKNDAGRMFDRQVAQALLKIVTEHPERIYPDESPETYIDKLADPDNAFPQSGFNAVFPHSF